MRRQLTRDRFLLFIFLAIFWPPLEITVRVQPSFIRLSTSLVVQCTGSNVVAYFRSLRGETMFGAGSPVAATPHPINRWLPLLGPFPRNTIRLPRMRVAWLSRNVAGEEVVAQLIISSVCMSANFDATFPSVMSPRKNASSHTLGVRYFWRKRASHCAC